LKLVLKLSVVNAGGYLAVNIAGTFCGAFLNGWLADRLGRRRTFVICACTQAVTVAIYTLAPISAAATVLLGFVLGTMQSGTAAGTGAFLAELFPTAIRATAQGFCGNAGRALGALAPAAVGYLTTSGWSLGGAMAACACGAYALVVIFAMALPETRGRDLRTVPESAGAARAAWSISEEAS
jgi:MFS family permease